MTSYRLSAIGRWEGWVGDYRQLQVWQRAHQLTLGVYQATQARSKEESYGLTSQIRRASASIPANIAERLRPQW
jgi:hypothetical protein